MPSGKQLTNYDVAAARGSKNDCNSCNRLKFTQQYEIIVKLSKSQNRGGGIIQAQIEFYLRL